jgi:multiple sugar transport system permease protein
MTNFVINPLLHMNAKLVMASLMSLAIFIYDPVVALVGISLFVVCYYLLFVLVRRRLVKNGKAISEAQSLRFKLMAEGFGGIKDALLLGHQKTFIDRFEKPSLIFAQAAGSNQAISQVPRYAMELVAFSSVIFLVLYLLAIPMGLFIALFLNQTVTGIRLYKSMFFFPFVISQVVVGLVFTWFYDPTFGLLNTLIGWVGLGPINVLGDPDYVTFGIIAAGLWPQTAYCMILYLTGLNAVDPEQIEAARLDGAKGWRMLWYVIVPQLKPATFIAFVVTIIGALRSFDLISIMTNGGPFGESRVLSFYMFEVALSEYGFRMGYGAAIAVVLFLIMFCFIAYFLRSMYKEEKGR